ncbi:AAA family ATPase [Streptomyces sp. SID10853]|uniref:AAA family ATPase n=1 Tax=Streptomyces sp. SID10853 TaxID=2706028 RepID=UPI0013C233CE|nr:AAA family ATPase [Streptomyces sp. SID10853]
MTTTTAGLRICVTGLAGAGKSTCGSLVEEWAAARGLSFSRVKLAQPLYDLQRAVYSRANAPLAEGAQDQVLMEALADAMRRANPRSLAEDFLARLENAQAQVIVNDDLRDPHVDAPVLREQGFRVVRVRCDEDTRQKRLAGRSDPSRTDRSTSELDAITPDAVITNDGELSDYRAAISGLLEGWL